MSELQGKWIWYELLTSDHAGAKAFYEAVVGWTITLGTEPPMYYGMIGNGGGHDMGDFTGGIMPLTNEMVAGGAHPGWLGYIAVDDCDATVAAAQAKGGKLVMPAVDMANVGRFALIADPGGAPFYLMTPDMRGGMSGQSTAFGRNTLGRCSWNELQSADQAAALDFYTSLFGWSLPEPMDMGPMGTYQFIEHDGVSTGAIMQKPAQSPMGGWAYYFRVADIHQAIETVKAMGGQLLNGPMEVPGGELVMTGMDPQGAAFGLVSGTEQSAANAE